ncbi:hypothetical protein CKO25_17910 [Thiocapsa imhoffii]|uniref:Uncharacterized protein n=1 Tax=Thiocapsa imhoffii TaxID=382777 RepID=A0A9X0WKM5_9GAMM|nr:hypothetical protein [Thiocapsa imhoffii]MBK1646486.1 hypothetical protein [Thiocapsa imhoffii]
MNGMRSCASDRKSAQVKRLLSYARQGEGIETLDIDVVVGFDDDDFEGQSFGLALALADKLARFQSSRTSPNRLCATGILGNGGQLSAVDAFPEKVHLAFQALEPHSTLAFPNANLLDHTPLLNRLAEADIELRAVNNLADLSELWQTPTTATDHPGPWKHWIGAVLGASLGLSIPSLLVVFYFTLAQ